MHKRRATAGPAAGVYGVTDLGRRSFPLRHGRACRGHPRLSRGRRTSLPGTSPGM